MEKGFSTINITGNNNTVLY